MRERIRVPSFIILLSIVLGACSTRGPGARAWIDAPLDQSRHPLEILEIIAHGSAAGGVSSFEFFVDGESVGILASGGGRLEVATFAWEPPGAGVYEIGVQAVDGLGVAGSRALATVVIGNVLLYGERGTEVGFGECEGVDRFYAAVDPPLIQPGSCAMLFWEVIAPEEWPLTVNDNAAGHVGEVTICLERAAFITLSLTTPLGTCRNWAHIAVRGDSTGMRSSGAPEIFIFADPLSISPGECSMLNWEVFPAGDYPVDINGTSAPFAGEYETCPEETRTYLLTAHHPDGPVQSSVTVVVVGGQVAGDATPTSGPGPTPDTVPPVISNPAVSPVEVFTSTCGTSCSNTTFHFTVIVTDNVSQDADIDVVLNWSGDGVRPGPENMHWTGIGDTYFNDLGAFVNAGYLDGFSITATDAAGNSATYPVGGWHLVVSHCDYCY